MIWHALVYRAIRRARESASPEAPRDTHPPASPARAAGGRGERLAVLFFVLVLLAALAVLVARHDPAPERAGGAGTTVEGGQ